MRSRSSSVRARSMSAKASWSWKSWSRSRSNRASELADALGSRTFFLVPVMFSPSPRHQETHRTRLDDDGERRLSHQLSISLPPHGRNSFDAARTAAAIEHAGTRLEVVSQHTPHEAEGVGQ